MKRFSADRFLEYIEDPDDPEKTEKNDLEFQWIYVKLQNKQFLARNKELSPSYIMSGASGASSAENLNAMSAMSAAEGASSSEGEPALLSSLGLSSSAKSSSSSSESSSEGEDDEEGFKKPKELTDEEHKLLLKEHGEQRKHSLERKEQYVIYLSAKDGHIKAERITAFHKQKEFAGNPDAMNTFEQEPDHAYVREKAAARLEKEREEEMLRLGGGGLQSAREDEDEDISDDASEIEGDEADSLGRGGRKPKGKKKRYSKEGHRLASMDVVFQWEEGKRLFGIELSGEDTKVPTVRRVRHGSQAQALGI